MKRAAFISICWLLSCCLSPNKAWPQLSPAQIAPQLSEAAHLSRNYPARAYELAQEAMQTAMAEEDELLISRAHLVIGRIQWYQGDYRPAQEHFRKALQSFQLQGDSIRIAQSWMALGTVDWRVGNFLGASEYYLKARRIFESQKDTSGLAEVYYWEGIVKADLENYQAALGDYDQALALARYQGDTLLQAHILNFVGRAYRKQKLYDSALIAHRLSLRLYKYAEDDVGISDFYNNVGSIYRRTGKFDSAQIYFSRALSIQEKLDDKEGLADGYIDLGRTLGQMRKYDEAIAYVNRGLSVAKEAGLKDDVRYGYQVLAGLYDSLDNYQEAFAYIRKYESVKDSLYAAQMRYQMNHMRFTYENEKLLENQRREREQTRLRVMLGAVIAISIMVILGILGAFYFRRSQKEQKLNRKLETQNLLLKHERERSDRLLLNILPEAIADELRASATGSVTPRFHPEVSVMFVDFKGFTHMAETMTPRQLVQELHECFREFDTIMEKHGLEKIKTIGDAYMCVGGLPDPLPDHAQRTIRAGLDIQVFMQRRAAQLLAADQPFFQARVGIHTGPVIAGVVGKHKFAYDLWGDTVNMASRMESSGAVGKVNISEGTYRHVHQIAICEPRGKVRAKNKGQVDMYFVDWIA